MPEPARSFADDLRARSDADLAALIVLRPDLARPAPADLNALAARAATLPSTRRALEQLDARQLHAIEALLVAGTSGSEAAGLLGATAADVEPVWQDLWARGLLWRSPEGMRPARAVGEALTHPAGLGAPAAALEVRLPRDLDAVIDALGPDARRVLDRLRWGPSRISVGGPASTAAIEELVDAGLLARTGPDGAALPREVAIRLRDGRLHEHPLDPPSVVDVAVLDRRVVDESAGGEALQLLDTVEEVARAWQADPPRVLRSGGLSVRDHRSLATRVDRSLDEVAFAVEIASAAGLFASDGEISPAWLPTGAYDDWRASTPARRWSRLARAWWSTDRAPSLVGTMQDGRSPVNVLSDQAAWPLLRSRRLDALGVLAQFEPGAAPSADALEEHLRWRRPLRLAVGASTHVDVVLREATWMGVVARGALSSLGRALVSGADPDAVEAAAASSLPGQVDHILVQADLTAIAPGPLTDDLARLMRDSADIESRGGATVFRFTEASIRRALDAGLEAAELLTRLQSSSRTGVPQPLEYLIADAGRRYGRMRIGSVGCYVRSDDEAALSALLADTQVAVLQLRRIAPTVLVSPAPAARALDLLRAHAAVAETSDGGLVLAPQQGPRAPTRSTRTPSVRVEGVDADAAAALVSRLRSAAAQAQQRRSERDGPDIPQTEAGVTVGLLADAVLDQAPVWLGYVDETGAVRRALFRPERVSGGRAVGTVEGSPARRTFAVHRITGVVPAR